MSSDLSMLELFRLETESQTRLLTAALLALEREPMSPDSLEACMRAAHSLKGAARIVDRPVAVAAAHAMEDCFVGAQEGRVRLQRATVDWLLRGVDLLTRVAHAPIGHGPTDAAAQTELEAFLASAPGSGESSPPVIGDTNAAVVRLAPPVSAAPTRAEPGTHDSDRVLRVTADNLNQLLALAGEALVAARWLKPHGQSLLRLKRLHDELGRDLDALRDAAMAGSATAGAGTFHADAQRKLQDCRYQLAQRAADLEAYDRRVSSLSHRLYDQALAVRMRPFADGLHGLARMVRDVGRGLGKDVRLEISGDDTAVDRDILDRLEAPLSQLLRNAVDHGIEPPSDRTRLGKPVEGVVKLDARHHAGLLHVTISDDGSGIDLDRLRAKVVSQRLTNEDTAAKLTESELLEFLFLPGFSLRDTVTEVSGRGVGLDVVQSVVKSLRGVIRVTSVPSQGMRFQLKLPLTLSVVRALLVDVARELYALPLAQIARVTKLPASQVGALEGRLHFEIDGRLTPLVTAHGVLGLERTATVGADLPVVLVGTVSHRFGLVVDRLIGERELVVQPLDPRLGKLKDIAAGALSEDGAPVLILDVDDVVRSADALVASGGAGNLGTGGDTREAGRKKRVLIVDDSLTVRELERKLLASHGYLVDVAVDGMDGWNAVRTRAFDLVVTDVDMPRLDGIELVSLIRRDPKLKALPVMIVSYKDRPEDRQRGLDAGADYYLTKGSFHDETLLEAVVDLIGNATA